MPNVKNNISAQETRKLLIEAAGRIFAERGVYAAKISDITREAGVNLAAVNYHFKDKFELYAAVIRHALSMTHLPAPAALRLPPRQRLRLFLQHLIDDLYNPSRTPWISAILAHEFANPTAALTAVIDEVIRPRVDYVKAIVRDIVGPEADEEKVSLAAMSVMSEYFIYLYNSQLIRRLEPKIISKGAKQMIADHLYSFCLGGLRAVRSERAARKS